MSFLLFGFVAAMAMVLLIYIVLVLRAVLFGVGFKSVGDMIGIVLIVAVSLTLVVWLGPIALAGVGLG